MQKDTYVLSMDNQVKEIIKNQMGNVRFVWNLFVTKYKDETPKFDTLLTELDNMLENEEFKFLTINKKFSYINQIFKLVKELDSGKPVKLKRKKELNDSLSIKKFNIINDNTLLIPYVGEIKIITDKKLEFNKIKKLIIFQNKTNFYIKINYMR